MISLMEILVGIIVFGGVVVLAFYISCYLVMLFTGCNMESAVKKVQNFLSDGRVDLKELHNDLGFRQEVAETIKRVIGEEKYNYMLRLSETDIGMPLLYFYKKSGLPCIAISTYCETQEKIALKSILSNIIRKYLKIYEYNSTFIAEWKTREDLNMPYLEFIYARDTEEYRRLGILLSEVRRKIRATNSPVEDISDKEDRNE